MPCAACETTRSMYVVSRRWTKKKTDPEGLKAGSLSGLQRSSGIILRTQSTFPFCITENTEKRPLLSQCILVERDPLRSGNNTFVDNSDDETCKK